MLKHLHKAVSGFLAPPDKDAAGNSIEYSFSDLTAATNNFSPQNKLGAGAAGAVYKGYLRGTEVAVKELAASPGQLNGFEDELEVLSRFRHPNLVTLLGWGQQGAGGGGVKYLVYELLPGGDLERRLRKAKDGRQAFPWQHRLSIAIDAACGLSYMVNSQPKAFHRDIKPPNILLDANGTAKMADFGLAGTVKKRGKGHLTVSDISGTPGYADPCYIQTGKVTEASEVYSYGTVLLELLMNERPALCGPNGDIVYPLVQVVQPAAPGAYDRVLGRLDPHAGWPRQLVEQFVQLALGCIAGRPEKRPAFEVLVETLRRFQSAAQAQQQPQQPPPQQYQALPPQQPQAPQAPPRLPGGREYASPLAKEQQQLSEQPPCGHPPHGAPCGLLLECIHADGVDLSSLPDCQRVLSFALEPASGRLLAMVGRQHQPEFFEAVVPVRERLACISRTHFEICWEPSAGGPALRKLSGNSLVLESRELQKDEVAPVAEGATLRFSGRGSGDAYFMTLRVALRDVRPMPAMPGPPAVKPPQQRQHVTAVLECVHAEGGIPANLAPEFRAVGLHLDEPVELGRQHQREFFDGLLAAAPQWLSFISRTHCRLTLVTMGAAPAVASRFLLQVENLSSNVVLICGRQLAKGGTDLIAEGGTLAFVAKIPGCAVETHFLRLELRRA